MPAQRLYTRIPPASTGDRITHEPHALVPYENRTGTFGLDTFLRLETSGMTLHVHAIYPQTDTTGYLGVHYDPSSEFNNLEPVPGEGMQLGGVTLATVSNSIPVIELHTANNVLVGHNNPYNGLDIDQFGSANVRFAEGNAQLDAFGKLRTSNATLLADYTFATSYLPNLFSNTIKGGGTIEWDGDQRAAVISTGAPSGEQITHTSNTYHHYYPGSSHLFMGTFALDQVGVEGLTRHWGIFEARNGFMFTEKDGVLGVTIRSSATGTTQDLFIPQTEWNRDKADGLGASLMNLNRLYDNIYWIDVQWLGGGRVRFGTYNDGTRVTLHEHYHGNSSAYPVSQTASLPVCMTQKTTGAVGSTYSMKSWCMSVWSESNLDIDSSGKPDIDTFSKIIPGSVATEELVYMGTLSPVEFLASGDINHSIYFPIEVDILSFDTVTNDPQIGEMYIYVEPVLSGLDFQEISPFSTVNIDTSATSYGGGIKFLESYTRGEKQIDLTKIFDSVANGSFKNYSEDGGTKFGTIANITQASPAVLTVSEPQHTLREGRQLTISEVVGMTEINGATVWPKLTGLQTMELYEDEDLTIPYDTTGFTAYSSGGKIRGNFGSRLHFSVYYKKIADNTNDVFTAITVNWKEIIQ